MLSESQGGYAIPLGQCYLLLDKKSFSSLSSKSDIKGENWYFFL